MNDNSPIKTKNNFIHNPTKKQMVVFFSVWFSLCLFVLFVTDLFTKGFFSKKYFMVYFMLFFSTWQISRVCLNYFKSVRDRSAM